MISGFFFSVCTGQTEKQKNVSFILFIIVFSYLLAMFFLPVMSALAFSVGSTRAESQALRLISLRTAGDMGRIRIIAVFNEKPDYDVMLLAEPVRFVVNLPAAEFPVQQDKTELHGFLKDVRYGMISHERSRMIFRMKSPFRLEHIAVAPLQSQIWQMVIDLVAASDREFANMLQARQIKGTGFAKRENRTESYVRSQPFTVMIDAGHGDFDSGAVGVSGVLEKEVTLDFVRTLRDILQKEPGIDVHLTRDDDIFLRLRERVTIARNYGADLFISVHADHIDIDSLRGVTVYTLSDRASDSLAGMLADHENRADLLDGLPPEEPPEVTDILIDLTRRETHAFSIDFANLVVDSLKESEISLIRNPHRYAGFQVLRAPDIPSILIELGYLSNAEDEKLISDPHWRKKMAELITGSVFGYADMHRRAAIRR